MPDSSVQRDLQLLPGSPASIRRLKVASPGVPAITAGLILLIGVGCAPSPAQLPTAVPPIVASLSAPTQTAIVPGVTTSVSVARPALPAVTIPLSATPVPQATGVSAVAAATAKPADPTAVVPTNPVPLAAVVNGSGQITMAALDTEVNRQLAARQSLNQPPPPDMSAFRSTVLDSLIQQALIEQAAAIQGISVTDQEVDAEVQKYIQDVGGRDKWLAQVAADQMTEADYRAGVKAALLTVKMRDFVTRNIGQTADQVHARHILVADAGTAQQVAMQLKNGADFGALAAQYSLDVTTKNNGGDLGWFTRGQLLQPAIENAAFALPLNQVSAPIQTDLGYDLLEVLQHDPNRPLDPAVRARLSEQTFEIWLQTLLKAARITRYV